VAEEHVLTGHFPTEVIKKFEIDDEGCITEEIEGEAHSPDHLSGNSVSCSCGEEWSGMKAEDKAKEHLRNVAEETEKSVLPLDEENELYGYGVYNTHKNTLVPKLGVHDPEVFDEEETVEHFEQVTEDTASEDNSHLRVVEIRLANELDKQASEKVRNQ
jgi:hypothetical protein